MSRRVDDPDALPRPRGEHVLNPLVALLAHHDDDAVAGFREVFDDVACDWRLVRMADSTAAARHVMNKGLPDLLIVGPDLPQVSGPDFVEWLRSFRSASSIPVLVYGEPADMEAREQFLRNDARTIVPAPCPRPALAAHLSKIVAQVERRRYPSMA